MHTHLRCLAAGERVTWRRAARLLGACTRLFSRLFSRRRVRLHRVRSCCLKNASCVSSLVHRTVGQQEELIGFERRFVIEEAIFGNLSLCVSAYPAHPCQIVIRPPACVSGIPHRSTPELYGEKIGRYLFTIARMAVFS